MLQTKAIRKETLDLLNELMGQPFLRSFSLAEGTGLEIGHRLSDDIDLFNSFDFDEEQILQELIRHYTTEIVLKEKKSLSLLIEKIKVDLLSYKYPLLDKIVVWEPLRLYSIKDIAAMKLSAVSSRGSKKDFYDLYFLLQKFSLEQLFSFYCHKFSTSYYNHVLKSLIYFEDAEQEPNPILLSENVEWERVKNILNVL